MDSNYEQTGFFTTDSVSGGASGYARSPSKYSREGKFSDYGGTAPTKRRESRGGETPRSRGGGRRKSEWEQVMDEDGNIVRFNPKLGLLSAPDVRPIIFFSCVFFSLLCWYINYYYGCENIFLFSLISVENTQSEISSSQLPKLIRCSGAGASYMVSHNETINTMQAKLVFVM